MVQPYQNTGLNVYDIRKPCGEADLCYDFSMVAEFLNKHSVKEQLGVVEESGAWEECDNQVNADFSNDWMKTFHQLLAPMLEAGVRALLYSGDCDYICNWMGNKAWVQELNWSGREAFNQAEDRDWVVGGQKKGLVRTHGPLTFMQVFEAGHMVPMDQPEASLTLLNTFTNGAKF
uniref:Carboxypeptidase n=1 Tax=Fibrocapsa japonica TaxID=94617 RepID=A0A7S2V6R2_9STRA